MPVSRNIREVILLYDCIRNYSNMIKKPLSNTAEKKAQRAAELVIANEEKAQRAARFVIANAEKTKRAAELVIVNAEKAKHGAEMIISSSEKKIIKSAKPRKDLISENEEKSKIAATLFIANVNNTRKEAEAVIANIEKARLSTKLLVEKENHQNGRKENLASELIIAEAEKSKREAELVILNINKAKRASELIIINIEKAKRDAELVIASKELISDSEKSLRIAEFIISNVKKAKYSAELVIKNIEKSKHAAELVITNKDRVLLNEKEKLTAELLIINNKLQQSIKLNADKDLFLSILAHDLRSPFSVLMGLSDFLIENIRKYDIDEIENHIKLIKNSAQDTFALLEDLLLWIRAHSGRVPFEPQKLNFADVCKNITDTLSSFALGKNITLKCNPTKKTVVFADADMLKTTLRNLVSNSIKFTNNGGKIDIDAEESSGSVTVTVSDNGIGLKPDQIKKLFDISKVQSASGTEMETGTGLGLVLCKEFITKHGGKIWVESKYGKGTDFKFTLPGNIS